MAETVVQTESDIEELSLLQKFDFLLKLADFDHSNCLFVVNLR